MEFFRKNYFLLILTVSCTSACQKSSRQYDPNTPTALYHQTAIVNGSTVAAESKLRKLVVLIISSRTEIKIENEKKVEYEYRSFCNGTMISKDIVLTAAHCVYGKEKIQVYFDVLDISKSNSENIRDVKQVEIHPQYQHDAVLFNSDKDYDLALVKLSSLAPDFQIIADLPEIDTLREAERFSFTAIGHGAQSGINRGEGAAIGILKSKNLISNPFKSKNRLFSVNQLAGGICSGDSGSPAILNRNNKYFVVGVADIAVNPDVIEDPKMKDMCKKLAYYTSVIFYRDWILKTMSSLLILHSS